MTCAVVGSSSRTAAGLALGLSLAGLDIQVQAVRVSHESIANRAALDRLMRKTCLLMNRLDPAIPVDLDRRTNVELRDDCFGPGYAHSTPEAQHAVEVARDCLGVDLESTYTAKAFAALIVDVDDPRFDNQELLFWNTYNSRRLEQPDPETIDLSKLPQELLRYFD